MDLNSYIYTCGVSLGMDLLSVYPPSFINLDRISPCHLTLFTYNRAGALKLKTPSAGRSPDIPLGPFHTLVGSDVYMSSKVG